MAWRSRAQQADGTLNIVDRHIGARRPAIRRQAITQHGALEAALREPFRRLESFLVDDHAFVPAARHDEQRDAIGGGRGAEERSGWARVMCSAIAVTQGALRRTLHEGLRARSRVRRRVRPAARASTVSPAGSVVATAACASGSERHQQREIMTRDGCSGDSCAASMTRAHEKGTGPVACPSIRARTRDLVTAAGLRLTT